MVKQESLHKHYTVDSKGGLPKTASMSEYAVCSFILFLVLSLSPSVQLFVLKQDLSHSHAVSLTLAEAQLFLHPTSTSHVSQISTQR